jgi:hypothetical protein
VQARSTWSAAALAALVLAVGAPRAHAGNGDGVLLGNEAAMTGGAVRATVRDGSAVWYNPAGLASIDRDAVDVSGNAVQARIAEEPGLISSTTGERNDGGYLEVVSIPSAATLSRRIERDVTLALGIFAPRYEAHETRTGLDAQSGAASARWTLSSAQTRQTYHAGGALGLRISDQLRLGISLFGVYRDSYDSFQTAGVFELPTGDTHLLARGGIRRIRSFGAELGLGIQWEPHPGVVIALTGRSPGLELATQIRVTTTDVDATLRGDELDELSFLPVDRESLAPGLAVLTPGHIAFALAHRFDRGWVALELDVQPPFDIEGVLERRLVYNVRVGGRYEVDDRIGIGFGAFTDHSEGLPIDQLGQTRVDFYGLAAGLEYRTPHRLGPEEGSRTLVFSTTFAVRYAFGVGEVAGLRFDPTRGTEPDTVALRTTIHEASLHIGSALYF